MAYGRVGEARWVMWIGLRQWEGLPGEFVVGQTGWVYPKDESAGTSSSSRLSARKSPCRTSVSCVDEDFLSFTLLENA